MTAKSARRLRVDAGDRVLKMAGRVIHSRRAKVGLSPGTLLYLGEEKKEPVAISMAVYSDGKLEEKSGISIEGVFAALKTLRPDEKAWVNVDGVHDTRLLEGFGSALGIHALVLEDIVNTSHRPKIEEHDDYLFIIARMLRWKGNDGGLDTEQVNMIVTANCVISFQERPGDVFDPVRERLRKGRGRMRRLGPDYLAYALLDTMLDHYFVVFEEIGLRMDQIEHQLATSSSPHLARDIQRLKGEALRLRKWVWPMREVVNSLDRLESDLIQPETRPFIRDLYDHAVNAIDAVESMRDGLGMLMDLHHSNLNNRMSEVMKTLTLIATVFMPLSFLAGIYGMNFAYIPGVDWRWGFGALMLSMLLIGGGMLVFFRMKGWLGGGGKK